MITDDPCPYCNGTDINIEDVIWVSFNNEGEGITEIGYYCQTCKNSYPAMITFDYNVTKREYGK